MHFFLSLLVEGALAGAVFFLRNAKVDFSSARFVRAREVHCLSHCRNHAPACLGVLIAKTLRRIKQDERGRSSKHLIAVENGADFGILELDVIERCRSEMRELISPAPDSMADVAVGCAKATVKPSSRSNSFSPHCFAAAICKVTACIDVFTAGSAILSFAVKSVIDLMLGLRVVSVIGTSLTAAEPSRRRCRPLSNPKARGADQHPQLRTAPPWPAMHH